MQAYYMNYSHIVIHLYILSLQSMDLSSNVLIVLFFKQLILTLLIIIQIIENHMASLYQRLGGQDAIKSVVDKFYVYMLSDPDVKEFFKNTDMNKQRQRQTQFITMVTGGPNNYQGLDMKKAHQKFKIGKKQFDATWANLQKSLNDHKVAAELIKEVNQIFYSVYDDVVNA